MADSSSTADGRVVASRGLFAALLPAHTGQAMAISLTAPMVPMLATHLGGGDKGDLSAQFVTVAPFLGIMAGGMISGWVMKATGVRAFVLLAALLFALDGVIGLFASGLAPLLIGAVILGFGAIFILTGLSALTAIAYDSSKRGEVIGLQAGMAGLSGIVFGLGASFLAERLGWRVPFAIFLGFGALVLVLTLLFVPANVRGEDDGSVAMGKIIKRIWPMMLAAGMAFMLLVSQSTQLPFLMAENGVTSSGLRGVVLTTLAAASMLGSVSFGALQTRISERGLILGVGFFGITAWIVFGLWSGGLAWAIVGAGLVGLAQGLLIPMLFGGVMRAVPPDAGGAAIGLLNVAICFGSFLNPVLSSPVRGLTGLTGLMFVLAAISATILVVVMSWTSFGARRARHAA